MYGYLWYVGIYVFFVGWVVDWLIVCCLMFD